MRGSLYCLSRRFTSSKRYFGVQSRCRRLAKASTSFRNFLGRFWKTRQSVFTATR